MIQNCRFLVKIHLAKFKMNLLGLNGLFEIDKQDKIKEQERKLQRCKALLREKEKAQESLAEGTEKKGGGNEEADGKTKGGITCDPFTKTMSFCFSGSYHYF